MLVYQAKDCLNCVLELSSVPVKVSYKGSMWTQHLDFYYFKGYQRRPSSLFLDVHLQFNLTDRDVKIYQGSNCSAVWEQYNNDYRLFGLLRQFSLLRSKQLNPFDCTVVGIIANEPYTVRLRIWGKVNYLRAGFFIGAIILYLLSYSLVRNALFFYSSGCALGLISSLLIVGFVVYRFAPKWIIGFPLLFGGWSVSFYGIYLLWRNFTNIVLRYQKFVAAYFATVLIVSFAICYRYGPPTDIRSHNLAQWALQLIALIIIYFSCQVEWKILILNNLRFRKLAEIYFLKSLLRNLPRTRRLLTLGEYERQGIEETRKAMEQLRSYCRSPQVHIGYNFRFASFVEGDCDHIEEEEIRLHEAESSGYSQYSDDSGEDEHLRNIRNSRRNVADLNNTRYVS
uniref:Nuclear envelope integral membrane protein 1 n=1 Tax=Syphacia muris TaxID=451379 RepID=A0A0N5AZD3_9BILA